MKIIPVLLAVVAAFGYAAVGVLLEVRFSKTNTWVVLLAYSLTTTTIALAAIRATKVTMSNLSSTDLAWLAVLGVVIVVADYAYVRAFGLGGNVFMIRSIMEVVPVVAATIKVLMGRGFPTKQEMVGYVIIVIGTLVFAKGGR